MLNYGDSCIIHSGPYTVPVRVKSCSDKPEGTASFDLYIEGWDTRNDEAIYFKMVVDGGDVLIYDQDIIEGVLVYLVGRLVKITNLFPFMTVRGKLGRDDTLAHPFYIDAGGNYAEVSPWMVKHITVSPALAAINLKEDVKERYGKDS